MCLVKGVTCCAFSPHSNVLITGSSDGAIRKWVKMGNIWESTQVSFSGKC